MRKKTLLFTSRISICVIWFFICVIVFTQKSAAVMTSTCPIPSNAVEIYAPSAYTCDLSQAGNPLYKAAEKMANSDAASWVDIASYITDAHMAQGFVDILVSVDISTANLPGGVDPEWYINGDSDKQDESDIRASCDGVVYDLIDPNFKTAIGSILSANAKTREYVTMRFKLPEKIYNDYKIYLGKGLINAYKSITSYSDSYQVKLYLSPISTGPYACADVVGVTKKYEKEYDPVNLIWKVPELKIYVPVNQPLQFDSSRSTDTSGAEIVEYTWDFGDGNGVSSNKSVSPVYIYRSAGTFDITLTITNSTGAVSTTNGSYSVATSSAPLPLVLTVIESSGIISVGRLYQNGPNPFIPSKYPKTIINYEIKQPSQVTIKLYTFSGRLVKTLVDEGKPSGFWSVEWDGRNKDGEDVASGIYFYHIESDGLSDTKKLVIIR